MVLLFSSIPVSIFHSNTKMTVDEEIALIGHHSIAYTEHDAINIVSDGEFIAQAALEMWSGNGSESNPYVIEGYSITYKGYSIRVTNVSAYFKITDCYLASNTTGVLTDEYDDGICLENVSHASISYNQIVNNEDCGIYVESSQIAGRGNLVLHNYRGIIFNHATSDNFIDCKIIDSFDISAWFLNCDGFQFDSHYVSTTTGLGMLVQDSSGGSFNDNVFNDGSVEIRGCHDCELFWNEFYNGSRLLIDKSSGILAEKSRVSSPNDYGIYVSDSVHCRISQNLVNSSTMDGIASINSQFCNFTSNNIMNCKDGIVIENTSDSLLTHNWIINQTGYGIKIESGSNNWVYGSLIASEGNGVFLDDGSENHWDDELFIGNFIGGTEGGLYQIDGSAGSVDHYARSMDPSSDSTVCSDAIVVKFNENEGILAWVVWSRAVRILNGYSVNGYFLIVNKESGQFTGWDGSCTIKVDITDMSPGAYKYQISLDLFIPPAIEGVLDLPAVILFLPGFHFFINEFIDDDSDDMSDDWEAEHSLNTSIDDGSLDPDNDGLSNLEEFWANTDPHNPDSDFDHTPDGWEVSNGLDPLTYDSEYDGDSDALTNLQEFIHGTDPWHSDTDSDAIPDGYEVYNGLNPLVNDAQGDLDLDSLTNLFEYQIGTSANNSDSDYDLANDAWEYFFGLDPLDHSDGSEDPDDDGLANYIESIYGTNPFEIDSDFDEYTDPWEIQHGFDPTDPHVSLAQILVANPIFFVLPIAGIATLFGGYRTIMRREVRSLKQQQEEYEDDCRRALEELIDDKNKDDEVTNHIESDSNESP
jgi:parallel beta-helix repeat protein